VKLASSHRWDVSVAEATDIQQQLRVQVVLEPPAGFAPHYIAGADVSMERDGDVAYAGIVTLEAGTLTTVEEVTAVAPLAFPYVPGFLSFRELPALAEAWRKLERRPDVLIFDGQGYAHPRRLGIASHGGLLFGVPSIGCAKSLLVGRHEPLDSARGATAPIVHRGEVVGMALRLRANVQPVYVSPGHLMNLATAVDVVIAASTRYREPETTRQAHRLVNRLRREG
jgi:deoxyribonuclease V